MTKSKRHLKTKVNFVQIYNFAPPAENQAKIKAWKSFILSDQEKEENVFPQKTSTFWANLQQWKWFEYFISDILGNLYQPFDFFVVCDKQIYRITFTLIMDVSYTLYSIELEWGLSDICSLHWEQRQCFHEFFQEFTINI